MISSTIQFGAVAADQAEGLKFNPGKRRGANLRRVEAFEEYGN